MLEKLYEVQTKDLELDRIDSEKQQSPADLLVLRADHVALITQLEAKVAEHHEVRLRFNANDMEIKNLDASRKSAAESALRAATAKEASQYQNQELQFSNRLQELQEDTLPLMEEMDGLEAEVETLKAALAELEPRLKEMEAAEEARLTSLNETLKVVQQERQALAATVPAPLLKQYEQVRRSKRGIGMTNIVGQSCGGCNMKLPLHVLQRARKGTDITRCPSCGRILWAKDN